MRMDQYARIARLFAGSQASLTFDMKHAFTFFAIMLITSAAYSAEMPKDSCIHVCTDVCTPASFAAMAKYDCRNTRVTDCYKKYATCHTITKLKTVDCKWMEKPGLRACLQGYGVPND